MQLRNSNHFWISLMFYFWKQNIHFLLQLTILKYFQTILISLNKLVLKFVYLVHIIIIKENSDCVISWKSNKMLSHCYKKIQVYIWAPQTLKYTNIINIPRSLNNILKSIPLRKILCSVNAMHNIIIFNF